MKLLVITALTTLAACSNHSPSSLSSTEQVIKVFLSEAQGTSRVLAASYHQDIGEGMLCKLTTNGCDPTERYALRKIKVSSQARYIYANDAVTSQMNGVYLIRLGQSERRLDFSVGPKAWKSILIAGPPSASRPRQLDIQRTLVAASLKTRGLGSEQIAELSSTDSSIASISAAMSGLKITNSDGCLVYLAADSVTNGAINLANSESLTPNQLDALLKQYCAQSKTVIILSASNALGFATPQLRADHRIIFASTSLNSLAPIDASDTTGETSSYFDQCLAQQISSPALDSFAALMSSTKDCVRSLAPNGALPESAIGSGVMTLRLPAVSSSPLNPQPTNPPTPSPIQPEQIGIKTNVNLTKSGSQTDLLTLAKGKKYLMIDFSASWCSSCLDYANTTLAKNLSKYENSEDCTFITLIDQGDLATWQSRVPASVVGHTYESTSEKIGALAPKFGASTSIPTTIRINVQSGDVDDSFIGNDPNRFDQMMKVCK
jgi:hypothetical protein